MNKSLSTAPVIEIYNLSFTYGCHPVLENISLQIMPGEVVGVTGPNGCGKTTLLKLITGQLPVHQGAIKVLGQDVSARGWRRETSYVPQRATHFNQDFPATVLEVVMSGITGRRGIFHRFRPQDAKGAREALELMELSGLANHPVKSLSGGQQQRVFIARALVGQSKLLILDEPTVGMDAASVQNFYSAIKKINSRQNITLVLVSHDLQGLMDVINRQVCLNLHLCSCCSQGMEDEGRRPGECQSLNPLYLQGRV